ncbi:MAG: DUF6804 family protein, partial [Patescibacteria group bacterium]|nr:DUF6804 family protein [Patescibacteria group bacterium]
MFYRHQYFNIDTKSKKVFDENNKELRLTGNAYRVLVFLCENKNVNITEIGDDLDRAKDYDENNIRQYKYKINTIIGHDIIEYKNGIYSLVGEIKKADKLKLKQRNKGLLREDSIKLDRKDIVDKIKNIKFTKNPAIVATIMSLLTFFSWPYGYYTFLRLVITGVAVYYAYYLYEMIKKQDFWFWSLVIIAVLFNPIIPIYLGDKSIWGVIDAVTAVF